MAFSFDFSHLSSFANAQHFAVAVCAPPQALKARPLGLVIDSIDSNVVAPDIDCRSISSLSDDCSQSSQSDDDTPSSTIVGFGRKRHSVLPTLPPFPDSNERSTIVGFGRKPHPNRQSIAAAPHALAAAAPSSVTAERKRENRRSLPNPIIPREPIDAKHLRRVSLDLGIKHTPNLVAGTNTRRASILGTARKVSDTIPGEHQQTTAQAPSPPAAGSSAQLAPGPRQTVPRRQGRVCGVLAQGQGTSRPLLCRPRAAPQAPQRWPPVEGGDKQAGRRRQHAEPHRVPRRPSLSAVARDLGVLSMEVLVHGNAFSANGFFVLDPRALRQSLSYEDGLREFTTHGSRQ
ncbi:hypothetical protein FB451DRAFT_1372847 [Mycena latifolia]|nr:hypothetical protein FB451DRAFT_1372847 [Mycena latifolia]